MRSYTDLEQSRKLAEFLPLESADMAWYPSYAKEGYSIRMLNDTYPLDIIIGDEHNEIPAWSLGALLDIIPYGQVNKMAEDSNKYEAVSWSETDFDPILSVEGFDTPVDACYELILKLNELNLL